MKKYIIHAAFILAIIIGLSVLLYPRISKLVNSNNQSRVVAQYFDDMANTDDDKIQERLEAAHEYNKRLLSKPDRFRFTEQDKEEYMNQISTDGAALGILVIEKIDVQLPIYHGTEETVLQVGMGHLEGSSLPVGGSGTHSFITGHRGLPSSTLLTNLDKITEGDTFVVHTLGETLTYQVDNIRTVLPDEMNSLNIDHDMDYCTLVTCTPYGINTHRLLVRGYRVGNESDNEEVSLFADAKRLNKITIILLFFAPVLPPLIIYIIIRCIIIRRRKIYKGGSVQ